MHVHPLLIADAVARRAQRFISVALMPAWNSRLRRKVGSAPGQFETLLADSIARGLQYFERLPGLELTSLIALWPSLQDGGEEHLRFLVPALQYYRSRFNNPDLRLFDDAYDPVAREVEGLRRIPPNHPINVLMERCLYADRMGLDAELLQDLARLEDGGFYGTTHIVWGCLLLRRFSNIDRTKIDALIRPAIDSMLRRQKVDVVGDLFAERIAFLQWAGRPDAVDPAWLWRLARAQRPDGGWRRMSSIWPQASSQHTSCLALAALLQHRNRFKASLFGDA